MPPEHEANTQAFYDHEQDEPRGRRRRAVADWGVSEDVFDRMPSRRFVRRGEAPRERSRREDEVRGAERGDARDEAEQGQRATEPEHERQVREIGVTALFEQLRALLGVRNDGDIREHMRDARSDEREAHAHGPS